jgi:DNA-binding transcriptional MerR regulator
MRFWEKEFQGILVPMRTRGGQRRYTPENIEFLAGVRKLREQGLGLGEIKRKYNNDAQIYNEPTKHNKIDLLANRVAEVVKNEVYSFFKREEEMKE